MNKVSKKKVVFTNARGGLGDESNAKIQACRMHANNKV